jgi:hypothetical protein
MASEDFRRRMLEQTARYEDVLESAGTAIVQFDFIPTEHLLSTTLQAASAEARTALCTRCIANRILPICPEAVRFAKKGEGLVFGSPTAWC